MDTHNLLSRRTLLKASPAALAALTVSPSMAEVHASRFTSKIAAYEEALAASNLTDEAREAAEAAVAAMGIILVPMGLLPNGNSPSGHRDLALFTEASLIEAIQEEAEGAKQRLCTRYAEALAPGRNADIAGGIDAMRDRSLAALDDAKALARSREELHNVPELTRAAIAADDALDEITQEILALVPVTPGEGLEKAAWLHGLLRERKGHFYVQDWDALLASIGGVRLPSYAEGL
ncbi:hypothetical protein [Devosia ginsengisoli]|uniref:hypothetical protein n=1 Tax=Devosia ginsengisoli TaxID=400770 RepID=UPI0026EDB9B1|nr:hypothetical protein [Devosia ginsengisoli]MCR6671492.1 hypothetical protein [Devosia ginsengisoli]